MSMESESTRIDPFFMFLGQCIANIVQYISNKTQVYTVSYIWKLLYMFRVLLPPIIRSAYNRIYRIRYLSHLYCYMPLSWRSWNWFECAVGGVRHPLHTQVRHYFIFQEFIEKKTAEEIYAVKQHK